MLQTPRPPGIVTAPGQTDASRKMLTGQETNQSVPLSPAVRIALSTTARPAEGICINSRYPPFSSCTTVEPLKYRAGRERLLQACL